MPQSSGVMFRSDRGVRGWITHTFFGRVGVAPSFPQFVVVDDTRSASYQTMHCSETTSRGLQVFASKQAPKKLTIFGSDFKSHDWCVLHQLSQALKDMDVGVAYFMRIAITPNLMFVLAAT